MESVRDESWPAGLDEVNAALKTLTASLEVRPDLPVLLQQVCEQVTAVVPGVDEATVTLLTDGAPTTAATTSEIAAQLDRDQYAGDDGPCLRAARTGALVRVSVAEAVDQWPRFAKDATTAGFGSFLSAPLVVGDGHAGAVNCYSASGHGFVDLDEKLLDLFTGIATALLRVHSRYLGAAASAGQLRMALESRAVIDQAKGILMAFRQVDADEAFALLVERSQRENRKLRDVATHIVTRVTGRDAS